MGVSSSTGISEDTHDIIHQKMNDGKKRYKIPKYYEATVECPKCKFLFNESLLNHKTVDDCEGTLISYTEKDEQWQSDDYTTNQIISSF